jgi:hypothetical protein
MVTMSAISQNYSIKNRKKDNFKKLFEYLLSVLPREKCLYSFTKKDLKLKRTAKSNREAILKGNFLNYNQNLVTELIFDIDNIDNLENFNLDNFYIQFYKKFNLPLMWSCKTNKGIQFCISTNTFYKLTIKQKKVISDFKEYIISNWDIIDRAGSKRLKGWWRNPLKKEFRFYGNRITFKEILEFLNINNLTIKQQFKKEIIKNKVKEQKKQKIYFAVGEPKKGNRNNFIWLNTMITTGSKIFENVLDIAKEFNKKINGEGLEEEELKKIAGSVWNYNKKNTNWYYINNKKAGWDIGSMGFEPIKGLTYKEYKEEVKRRQEMAGKRTGNEIGKQVLIKANKEKAIATKEKVYKTINKLKEQEEKVTIRKVKELAGVSLATAQKYVKQAREEEIL